VRILRSALERERLCSGDPVCADHDSTTADAAKAALVNAILRQRLSARIIESGEEDFGAPDWHKTTIAVEDLRAWLRSRGFKTGFFFPVPEAVPDYLSEFHPN
jgi:hypothetical protein